LVALVTASIVTIDYFRTNEYIVNYENYTPPAETSRVIVVFGCGLGSGESPSLKFLNLSVHLLKRHFSRGEDHAGFVLGLDAVEVAVLNHFVFHIVSFVSRLFRLSLQ